MRRCQPNAKVYGLGQGVHAEYAAAVRGMGLAVRIGMLVRGALILVVVRRSVGMAVCHAVVITIGRNAVRIAQTMHGGLTIDQGQRRVRSDHA